MSYLLHLVFSFLIFYFPFYLGSGWGVGTSLDKMIAMQAQMEHFATALEGMHDTVTSCQVVLQQLVDGTYANAMYVCMCICVCVCVFLCKAYYYVKEYYLFFVFDNS